MLNTIDSKRKENIQQELKRQQLIERAEAKLKTLEGSK